MKWYAFYTKSRHEKKVLSLLQKRGYQVFLPMRKTMRQWSDRKVKVEEPLFRSYIFVLVDEHHVVEIVQVPGIAWVIRHNSKPAFLHEKEYELITRFLETGLLLESVPIEAFEVGDDVIVADGVLKGISGRVLQRHPDKLIVVLETLGQAIRVEINPLLLKLIE